MKAPKKLSEAIFLALNDMALVEQDIKYKIEMNDWHRSQLSLPDLNMQQHMLCHVCMAGSVMAKTLGIESTTNAYPTDFKPSWTKVFQAINHVRIGHVSGALSLMKVSDEAFSGWDQDSGLDYAVDPELFKDYMCDVATMLESVGY